MRTVGAAEAGMGDGVGRVAAHGLLRTTLPCPLSQGRGSVLGWAALTKYHSWGLKQQTFLFSLFWRLAVQDQDATTVRFS